MYYAQQNYSDKVGNSNLTLKQIGCFVTSFANTLKKFGEAEAPDYLNLYFTEHKVYMHDEHDSKAEGKDVHDDLAYGSITAFDHTVTVSHTGNHGWPDSDNAIVEFHYVHNGNKVVHFCAVSSHVNKTIIDSYDGLEKHPGIYGEPVSWAVYVKNTPKPVTQHPKSQMPVDDRAFKVITVHPGWGLERVAAFAGRPDANYPECWQDIAVANDSTSWQSFNAHLKPGQHVIVPSMHGHGEGIPEAESPPLFSPSETHLDESEAGLYKALETVEVKNLADPSQTEQLPKKNPVTVAGGFTWYGTHYLLPTYSKRNGTWFAIPADKLKSMKTEKTPAYHKLLAAIGGTIGFLTRNKTRKV